MVKLITRSLRRHVIALIVIFIMGIALGAGAALVQRPHYESMTRLFVSTSAAASATDLNQGGDFSQQVVKSYADVASSAYVLNPVIKQLGLNRTSEELARSVVASAPLNTSVVNVTVTDRSAVAAARIANAIAGELKSAVNVLTPRASNDQSIVTVTQIEPARPAVGPSSPKVALNLFLGGLIGLGVGVVFVILRDLQDTRIRTVADLAVLGSPSVLGTTHFDADAQKRPLVMAAESTSVAAESYRTLRTNLRFLDVDLDARIITATSAVPGEGKSTVVSNLALAVAAADARVLLVDADLRRPRIASYFDLEGSVGLTDVLVGTVDIDAAMQVVGAGNLFVLPAGSMPPNPSELLQSDRMTRFVSEMRTRFDYVLFDAPPILPVADGAILSKLSDGVLFMVASSRSRQPQVRSALHNLAQVNARVLGVVMTMASARDRGVYGYGYGVGYGDARPA